MIPHSRPTLGREEQEAVKRVIESGRVATGETVKEFEEALARYVGVKHAAAVNSGTTAIQLALEAKGLRGIKIAVPTYSCTAIAHAVMRSGNTPVLVGAGEDLNIDFEAVKKAKPDVKAVVAAHMHGLPFEARGLREWCDAEGVFFLEDCAQSIGASVEGRKNGAWGHASMYSFFATKMVCAGEGGMVASNDAELIERVKQARTCDVGRNERMAEGDFLVPQENAVKGNYKLSDVQAAMGLEQLKKLDGFIAKRREIAARYKEAGTECLDGPGNAFYRFLVKTDKPQQFVKRLFEKGVAASVLYPAIHEQDFFKEFAAGDLSETEEKIRAFASIPVYPSLTEEERETVARTVCEGLSL